MELELKYTHISMLKKCMFQFHQYAILEIISGVASNITHKTANWILQIGCPSYIVQYQNASNFQTVNLGSLLSACVCVMWASL